MSKKIPPKAISLTQAPEISLKELGCIFLSLCIEEINKRSASGASMSLMLCFTDDKLQFHCQVFTHQSKARLLHQLLHGSI